MRGLLVAVVVGVAGWAGRRRIEAFLTRRTGTWLGTQG